jgi:hypothetical protein
VRTGRISIVLGLVLVVGVAGELDGGRCRREEAGELEDDLGDDVSHCMTTARGRYTLRTPTS